MQSYSSQLNKTVAKEHDARNVVHKIHKSALCGNRLVFLNDFSFIKLAH